MNDKIQISLVEQAIMNEDFLHELKGWRCYRIEYVHEGSDPEGIIYLPPDINPDAAERVIKALIEGKQIWWVEGINDTSRSL